MNNYSQYKTWQEVDGKLSHVCEKPELKENKISNSTYTYDIKEYDKAMDAYNESLKISLPIIGDIESIRGRKDLVLNKDFVIRNRSEFYKGNYTNQCAYCKEVFHNTDKLWFICQKCCDEQFAHLIDNKPKEEVPKQKGMDKLSICRFQAAHIKDTFRLIANALESQTKETCLDRMVMKSIDFINETLASTPQVVNKDAVEWISIDDKLPELKKHIWNDEYETFTDEITDTVIVYDAVEDAVFPETYSESRGFNENPDITHWMPLPHAPEPKIK